MSGDVFTRRPQLPETTVDHWLTNHCLMILLEGERRSKMHGLH